MKAKIVLSNNTCIELEGTDSEINTCIRALLEIETTSTYIPSFSNITGVTELITCIHEYVYDYRAVTGPPTCHKCGQMQVVPPAYTSY